MSQQTGSKADPARLQRLTDRDLIQHFAGARDEAAFRILVERHGALVFRACLGTLRHHHDAEDAFQATFLVLAQKAGQVRWHNSLANWLYTTACRISLKAMAQRKQRGQPMSHEPTVTDCFEEVAAHDAERTLHEELNQLPEQYRAPLLLCYLEGKTQKAAAEELGLTPACVNGRLQRGRHELRLRLLRRGIGLPLPVIAGSAAMSAGTAEAASSFGAAPATVPEAMVTSTVQAATQFAAGGSLTGAASAQALALAKGELAMTSSISILKSAAAAVVTLAFLGVACLLMSRHVSAEKPNKVTKIQTQLANAPVVSPLPTAVLGVAEKEDQSSSAKTAPTVQGQVVNEQGEPVTGARIRALTRGGDLSTESGEGGAFQLKVPLEQRSGLMLHATHQECAQQAYYRDPYERKESENAGLVRLVLRPAREIPVQVVDAQEQPVSDAWVAAVVGYRMMAEAETGGDGQAVLRVPRDAPLQTLAAVKPGVGLDYYLYRRQGQPASDPYKLSPDYAKPLTFSLDGTRTVTVRVVDENDRPLPDVGVYPWYFERPEKGGDFNLSGLSRFKKTTDANGVATFDTVPADNAGNITFWARTEGYFAPERPTFDPDSDGSEVVARLVPMVPVSGRFTFPDSRPAADIDVHVAGDGYQFDSFRGSVSTGQDGRFELQVNPDQYYLFVAGSEKWASPLHTQVIRQGQPVDGIELILQPATRVYGRVTVGSDREPLTNEFLSLYQKEDREEGYYQLPEEERLPNPKDSRDAIYPIIGRNTYTDEEGRFEFHVGPGHYYIIGPDNAERPKFTITDQKSLEVNLHASRPDTGRISGRVVLKENRQQGVAEAEVLGFAVKSNARGLRAVADAQGRFQAERGLSEMFVRAQTKDGNLQGIVRISAEAELVEIPVGPTASAHGRLIEETSGEPLPNRQIDYGIHIDFTEGTFGTRFGSSTTTDDGGRFTITGLVPDWEYTLNMVMDRDSEGRPRGWRQVATVTAQDMEQVELGEVVVKPSYRPPTVQERLSSFFETDRDLQQRFEQARADARREYKHVLLIFGDADSKACHELFEMLFYNGVKVTREAVRQAGWNYVRVAVKTNAPNRVTEFLRKHGIDVNANEGPMLVVVKTDGTVVDTQRIGGLNSGQPSPEELLGFLSRNAPKPLDAERVLADALQQARKDNKRVFLQHTGPYCYPCRLLSRFIDRHKELFARDYLYVKIDNRFENAHRVIDRLRPGKERSIPWFAILDSKGEVLVTSNGPDGNIGYPSSPVGIAYFEKMLRTTAVHLKKSELQSLVDNLSHE